MKIILTETQARATIQALEWAIDPDYPKGDEGNARYIRIINKIKDGLGEPHDNYDYLGQYREPNVFEI